MLHAWRSMNRRIAEIARAPRSDVGWNRGGRQFSSLRRVMSVRRPRLAIIPAWRDSSFVTRRHPRSWTNFTVSNDAATNEQRPALYLFEHFRHVLPDQPNRKQVDRAKQHHHQQQRCYSWRYERRSQNPQCDLQCHQEERDTKHDRANSAQHVQRNATVGKYPFLRPTDIPHETIRRHAEHSFGSDIV